MKQLLRSSSAFGFIAAAAGVSLLTAVAFANHAESAKAKKARFELVNAYFASVDPNENTATSNGTPACAPSSSADAFGCALSPGGSGKLTLTVVGDPTMGTQDVNLSASLKVL